MGHPELLLKPNDQMQLEFTPATDDGRRYAVTVVGFKFGESLLVTVPERNGKPIIITEGQSFNARMLAGKEIVGFQTCLLKLNLTPFPYMHLVYPQELQRLTVRGAMRVETEETVMVSSVAEAAAGRLSAKPALLVDLSASGGRLGSRESLGSKETKLRLSFGLSISGDRHAFNLDAVIRNVQPNTTVDSAMRKFYTGVEFDNVPRAQRVLLTAFLNEQLLDDYGSRAANR